MNKMRSNATWNTLKPEQKEIVEEWLFVQNLSYKEVQKRSRKFKLNWSQSSIQRTYQHLARLRAIADVARMETTSKELTAKGCKAEEFNPSVMKMIGTRLLEQTIEKRDLRGVAVYGRLMMQGQMRKILHDRTQLAIRKHEFNASQAALKAMPLLDEFTKEDEERDNARIKAVRRRLFGPETKEGGK
jgi:hypothetical protein